MRRDRMVLMVEVEAVGEEPRERAEGGAVEM
jgi:hypothetical protein